MSIQTNPCEEFEIAALRRARGALDRNATTRLDAHVASCAGCREFAATAEATEAALRGRTTNATIGRDWDKVRVAVRALEKLRRNRAIRGAIVLAVLAPVTWWALGWVCGVIAAVVGAVSFFVYDRTLWRPNRRARRLASIDSELLTWYRHDLDKEIDRLRKQRTWGPMLFFVFGLNAAIATLNVVISCAHGDPILHARPALMTVVLMLTSIALTVGPDWRQVRTVLPQLERERRELGK